MDFSCTRLDLAVNPIQSNPSRALTAYVKGLEGETAQPYIVLIMLRKTGTLFLSDFSGIGSWLRPGSISSVLS